MAIDFFQNSNLWKCPERILEKMKKTLLPLFCCCLLQYFCLYLFEICYFGLSKKDVWDLTNNYFNSTETYEKNDISMLATYLISNA